MSIISRLIESSHCDSPSDCVTIGGSKKISVNETPSQYVVTGNTFKPIGPATLTRQLLPGAYEIHDTMTGVVFEKVTPKTDELLEFKDSSMLKVVTEIDHFWNQKQTYDRLHITHNRGILLYGEPGTGKSSCLQQVVEMMVQRDDVVMFAKSPRIILEGLRKFREVEPDRRVVVCFEEADELARYDESTLLRLMDGDSKIDQVLFIATTNYIDRLPPRMLRPGRFDKKVHIAPPNYECRLQYLKAKLKDFKVEEKIVCEMAKRSNGMSFGHLRELVAGVFAIGDPMDDVFKRLSESKVGESKARESFKSMSTQERSNPCAIRIGGSANVIKRLLG